MELSINAQNLKLTDQLQKYIEKKTGRLDRYMPNLSEARLDLAEQNARNAEERQVAQLTVRDHRGTILRAEERSNDIFAAVDAVVDKIYRQMNRYRGKQRRNRRGGGEAEEMVAAEPLPIDASLDEEVEATIVRRKRFSLRPMSVEEAADQMELLGHDFYVFFNSDDDAINVIYKRRDSNYGLLQPDMG